MSYFDRIEDQLVRAVEARAPRPRPRPLTLLGAVAAVAAVVVVVAVAATTGRSPSGQSSSPAPGTLVFRPTVTPASQLSPGLNQDVAVLRARLHPRFPEVQVSRVGDTVLLSGVPRHQQSAVLDLTAAGRWEMLDWEASVLLPGGETVSAGLRHQDARAMLISQGSGTHVPGMAGAEPLLTAVRQGAHTRVPGRPRDDQFFAFRTGCRIGPTDSCLLAGPAASVRELRAGLPPGTRLTAAEVLGVPAGVEVVRAARAHYDESPPDFGDPSARYFVLRDRPGVPGIVFTHPRVGTDQSGEPDVLLDLIAPAARIFHRLTATLAHRGDEDSGFGQMLMQHFGVILDGRVLTVPSIDFRTYPDGIDGGAGLDLTGGFTRKQAAAVAALLRDRPLAVPLAPVS